MESCQIYDSFVWSQHGLGGQKSINNYEYLLCVKLWGTTEHHYHPCQQRNKQQLCQMHQKPGFFSHKVLPDTCVILGQYTCIIWTPKPVENLHFCLTEECLCISGDCNCKSLVQALRATKVGLGSSDSNWKTGLGPVSILVPSPSECWFSEPIQFLPA